MFSSETHKFPFSPGNECHCLRTPKSSMENPSLRVSGHVSQLHEQNLHRGRLR